MKYYQKIFRILLVFYALITLLVMTITFVNVVIYINTKDAILPASSYISSSEKKDFAIVLGASVHGDRLSQILRARVEEAIDLYQKGLIKNILMSGDGLSKNYNETIAMKRFAVQRGVPSENIFTDTGGTNTYISISRAKNVFKISNAYIISQEFHVGRAVWIAQHMEMNIKGVSVGKFRLFDYYTIRDIFARVKDFFQIFLKLG